MNRPNLLATLLFVGALILGTARSIPSARADEAPRPPMGLIVCVPANRSPDVQKLLRQQVGRLYGDVVKGDRLVVINASTRQTIVNAVIPDLGTTDNERDNALLDVFAPVNAFVAHMDPSAQLDNAHIIANVRDIEANILQTFEMRPVNAIFIGKILWSEPHESDWDFRTRLPSDYFLLERGGWFGLRGEETALKGVRVSILFTDKNDDFAWNGWQQMVVEFYRKSILGRGGTIGEIGAYAQGSYPRFFASTEDTRAVKIDTTAPKVLYAPGSVGVRVVQLGDDPPINPDHKEPSNVRSSRSVSRRHGNHSHPAGAGSGFGHDHAGSGSVPS